jgi:hypothetical protein
MANPYPDGTGEHLLYAIFGEEPQDNDPDCACGHPSSEHGQIGNRCYYEGKQSGRCGCDELRIAT